MPATAAPRAQSVKVSGVVRMSSVQRWVSTGPGRSRSSIDLVQSRRVGEGGDVLAGQHDAGGLERPGERWRRGGRVPGRRRRADGWRLGRRAARAWTRSSKVTGCAGGGRGVALEVFAVEVGGHTTPVAEAAAGPRLSTGACASRWPLSMSSSTATPSRTTPKPRPGADGDDAEGRVGAAGAEPQLLASQRGDVVGDDDRQAGRGRAAACRGRRRASRGTSPPARPTVRDHPADGHPDAVDGRHLRSEPVGQLGDDLRRRPRPARRRPPRRRAGPPWRSP